MMKYALIVMLIAPLSVSASSAEKWIMVGNSIPVLPNSDKNIPVNLMIGNSSTGSVAILDLRGKDTPGTVCFNDGESRGIQPIGPFSINGKMVKMNGFCINHQGVIAPTTQAGKDYLNGLVWSGKPISIDIGDGVKLTYPESDIQGLKKQIKDVNDAM